MAGEANDSWVFVTQVPARKSAPNGAWVPTVDISDAERFGRTRIILPSGINHNDTAAVVDMLSEALLDFRVEDYLLPMGDPVVMAIASGLLARRLEVVQYLKWDRFEFKYRAMTVNYQEFDTNSID